uniref:RRM domain-containing protein n=1 Tax=Chlamydomonas leiostraca TaxID=1034604 RepID=A0A6T8QA73_9CHLO|mmetsp:Transcript_16656/g.41631  ORF Transcript_16656/g.41631 Transcript_16656/m.41631 type:complete len:500 (+) Transcript_16656:98-1597(+)|eukprot:CAMPEP_0202865818 /NCGR_PEP_ID=MMETSP1391-20130828/6400_1 /ASSEMBLY_ACC=CAM_ASM_000867 /TAXON_ID=1034604 /ORGANISM="Chlamydomonas leiostraca, Strain SAG 11-49" /LENGTH=499 /DNA_ID=CAMNT_0049545697 /DNA_START=92 /DNA_END=1591 /DNA_ORIENTATION=+
MQDEQDHFSNASGGSSSGSAAASAAPSALPLDRSVKMKGLPFKASPEDIVKFFQGFVLRSDNIFLKRHPDGRPNGEAFIAFESADEARRATQKDRETFGDKFGDRYVRVYPTLESDVGDMQQAVMQQSMAHQQGNGHGHGHSDSVVKIKSLPFDANQLDIIQFFDGFKLKPNGVQLVVRSDNKPTGEAFVDFESSEEAARAIREKDHKVFSEKFGDRYVRLIQVSRKEMQATLALRFGGEGILKMKGIPFKATANDVRKFFQAYKIKPDGISFIMHADGRPTGMAFIEFETPQEAVRAMEKDRAKFGPEYGERFCMLQLVGRHEMDKVQLQKEGDPGTNKLLNGINVLQAAAIATQAALQNPALQPILMAQAANPWLNHTLPFGLVNPASAAALAGAQLGQMPSLPGVPNSAAGAASAATSPMLDATLLASQLPIDPTGASAAAANPLLFYQNQSQDWQRAAAADPRGLGMPVGHGWPEQLAAAARQRTAGFPGATAAM